MCMKAVKTSSGGQNGIRSMRALLGCVVVAALLAVAVSSAVPDRLHAQPAEGKATSRPAPADVRDVKRHPLVKRLGNAMAQALKGGATEGKGPAEKAGAPQPPLFVQEPDQAPEETAPVVTRTDEGLLELHLRDADLSAVLRLLSVEGKRNIIAGAGVTGKVTADLYGVTFQEALEAVLAANLCGYREDGKFVFVHTLEEIQALTQPPTQPEKLVTRVIKLAYLPATEALPLVETLISDTGSVTATAKSEEGVESTSDTLGNALALMDCIVVRDRPEHVAQIEAMLEELDVRPQQVLIEATILRAALSEQNELGIDFNTLAGVDFEALNSTSPGVTDLTTRDLSQGQMNNTSITTRTDFNDNVTSGGFTFGVIKDQIAVFIRALEQVTDTTVLANPKILALNKQAGSVIVGRRDGYMTTTVTETAAIETVEFLETGTQLRFRPFIGRDGWVRVELRPKDSNGGLTADNLPFEETTEVTTNLMVKDGHTIVIGGLFRENSVAGRSQVPLLGDIPGMGLLFRSSNDQTRREEVIVLLTLRILEDSDAENEMMEAVREDIERVRLGARRGLLGIGRERLAQAHYRAAIRHLRAGRDREALFDVDLTLHHNTRHSRALKLRERLLGRRLWGDEGMQMRTFMWELIEAADAEGGEPFGRPDPLRMLPGGEETDEADDR